MIDTDFSQGERAATLDAPASGPLRAYPRERRSRAQRWLEGRGWTALRIAVDAGMLALALIAARMGAPGPELEPHGQAPFLALFAPLTMGLLALRGMYQRKLQVRTLDGLAHVVSATSVAAMVLIAATAFMETSDQMIALVARTWFFGTVYVAAGRVVIANGQRRARVAKVVGKPTLIVGAGVVGAQVERRLEEQPELGLRPIGYLDPDPAPDSLVPDRGAPVLGSPSDLGRIVDETGAEHVVLAFLNGPDHDLLPIVRECSDRGLEVSLVPRLFESINVRVGLEHIGGLPLFGLRSVNPKGWQFAIKHAFDRVAAGLLVLALSPVLLAITLAVKLSSPGPVFFRQRRIGRDGRDFDILKFRSMKPADPAQQQNVSVLVPPDTAPGGVEGADRRTRVGSFLRRTSLDELPQLFNVLRGEMSIVGPRPERPQFVELFGQQIRRYEDRHRVRSGITGWAQVHGLRGKTSLSDRVEWDNYYIENWSLALDLKILLMTLVAVFRPAE